MTTAKSSTWASAGDEAISCRRTHLLSTIFLLKIWKCPPKISSTSSGKGVTRIQLQPEKAENTQTETTGYQSSFLARAFLMEHTIQLLKRFHSLKMGKQSHWRSIDSRIFSQ